MAEPVSKPIRLFSADLDGTLLGNPESTGRFFATWKGLAPNQPLLVFNSGRLVDDMRDLVTRGLLSAPDYYIGGVGTEIFDVGSGRMLEDFHHHLAQKWDRGRVDEIVRAHFPEMSVQPEQYQTALKSSWYFERAPQERLAQLQQQLRDAGIEAQIVYSSHRDLDILPAGATKGEALRWLGRQLGIGLDEMLVAGDTGNDASMFLLPNVRGIIVQNAQPELLEATVAIPAFTARHIMADGVLDGLRHFGVYTGELPRAAETEIPRSRMAPGFRMLFTGTRLGALNDDDKRLILRGYERAVAAVKKNITPLGFSACSLTDNTVTGTDANYRSVWARDGAITLINTLDVDDPDVRACHRRTLDTLLRAAAPNGQIPANVRIDDGVPDYAGVGNICSIDSGLWVIIAFFNYIDHTGDIDFLREHHGHLQRAMDWLSAHDSNNDGLLEIPEAGDWTDLFGRSYNVLYDEVLWFRTNVCFGRLLELLGDFERAADYLRWSQQIRSRILDVFWPTTSKGNTAEHPHRFASRQFDLGDTQYLVAEITPFAFNWRCDVYANVLAYLMNLLDVDRARTAFRFMWGVGVNEPLPVANLYPVVQAGDPDWRAYYTVNLLNLPYHYHNGGIWPFVGGMWVRFIHRLGFHEVATRELVRLARANQLGRDQEWEFNEWIHGKTGRPMGKAFQAWSAACFIRACQEVEADPAHLTND
jgi:sucrose-6-phosphatase